MKCKIISFFMCLLAITITIQKVNKLETIDSYAESKYVSKEKDKKPKKVKKVKKTIITKPKPKKITELEYWSDVVGKKVTKVTKVNAKLSFFTDLDIENYEGCGGMTASGHKLFDGVIANNLWSMGTIVYFKGYGEYQVLDTGGNGLNTWNNFDMYIPRLSYENDLSYYQRVNNLGIKSTTGYVLEITE